MKKVKQMHALPRRYFYFLLGLAVNSFGVALVTKCALGTSQISSIPYVFSLYFDQISFGMFTFLINMIFIAIQLLLLRRNFPPVQFLQVAANLLFSVFLDLSMYALHWFAPEGMVLRWISLLVGCVIVAVGLSIEVAPQVIVVPGDGIVRTIAQVKGREFGWVKVRFDLTLIAIAVACSFLFFHTLRGLGAGTVISALLVGRIVCFTDHHFPLIRHIRALTEQADTVQRADAASDEAHHLPL